MTRYAVKLTDAAFAAISEQARHIAVKGQAHRKMRSVGSGAYGREAASDCGKR